MELPDLIDRQRLISTFTELIQINSPSYGEKEIGSVLAGRLESLGCRVDVQDYGPSFNIIARKEGNKPGIPSLLLSGHMDTIEPTEGISFSHEEGVIRTTGDTVLGADDKSALAQILEALAVLRENEIPHGDIEVVFTSAEEAGLVGAKNLDFSRIRSRHGIVLDSGGSVGSLVTAAPTHLKYQLRVSGRSAHAGIEPEKGVNSVRVAAKIVSEIPDGRIDAVTTANVGMIAGGTATNVVPRETKIRGELRSHNPGVIRELKGRIFGVARSVAEEWGARIEISEEEEYRSFTIERDEPFLVYLAGIYRRCGIEPLFVSSGGGSDANVLNQRGIRVINISNGMQNVHSTEEQISAADLWRGCSVVLTAVAEFGKFWSGRVPPSTG